LALEKVTITQKEISQTHRIQYTSLKWKYIFTSEESPVLHRSEDKTLKGKKF